MNINKYNKIPTNQNNHLYFIKKTKKTKKNRLHFPLINETEKSNTAFFINPNRREILYIVEFIKVILADSWLLFRHFGFPAPNMFLLFGFPIF